MDADDKYLMEERVCLLVDTRVLSNIFGGNCLKEIMLSEKSSLTFSLLLVSLGLVVTYENKYEILGQYETQNADMVK